MSKTFTMDGADLVIVERGQALKNKDGSPVLDGNGNPMFSETRWTVPPHQIEAVLRDEALRNAAPAEVIAAADAEKV